VIHIGETLPLGVSVACVLRRETRQIVEILSGGSMDSVQPEITSVAERPGEIVRKPSFIKLFLSGTGAALAGNAVGVLLGGVLIALLMSPNDFESQVCQFRWHLAHCLPGWGRSLLAPNPSEQVWQLFCWDSLWELLFGWLSIVCSCFLGGQHHSIFAGSFLENMPTLQS
jgi:hypothetical protein